MIEKLKYWLGKFEFWLILTIIHRLFSIAQPPLETAHNWRQTTVTMVARNFLEIDANPFYPRVDMAGELSGICGMEFPLLNYLIYLVSLVFGYEHWYGRLINLLIASLGLWYFFKYLKSYFSERFAFSASMILLFSLCYYYSRKIMPDTFSIALIFMGIYLVKEFVQKGKWWRFFGFFAFTTLGLLSKLPAIAALVFIWPAFLEANKKQKIFITSALAMSGLITGIWYFYWVPFLDATYGYHHFFMGESFSWTLNFLKENWTKTLHLFYEKALGYSGFAALLAGIFFARKNKALLVLSLMSIPIFIGFLLKSADKFTNHEYYIIPFIPIMALIAAEAISRLPKKVWIFALVAISAEGVIRKWSDQFTINDAGLVTIESEIAPFVASTDLIVINSDEFPTPMYFAHRKGWLASNDQLLSDSFVSEIKNKGCKFAIVLKKRFGKPAELPYHIVKSTEDFDLYEL